MLKFGSKRVNFGLQGVILFHLALQEPLGGGCLLRDAIWSQDVNIAEFVLRVGETLHFHHTLFDERLEAVVQSPNADAELFRQLALGEVRIFLQNSHHSKIGVFLQFGLATCHNFDELRPYSGIESA
jgi:hypothetical protein